LRHPLEHQFNINYKTQDCEMRAVRGGTGEREEGEGKRLEDGMYRVDGLHIPI
jgi:hypothetical protein